MSKEQMNRGLDRQMMEELQKYRSERIREKAKLKTQGMQVSTTESESSKGECLLDFTISFELV